MDESALIKKHVRSINFLKGIPPGKDTPIDTSPDNSDGDSNNSFSVSCQSNNNIPSDRIDSIKSCESILKIFTFETHNFNKNNEKCLAFWNALNERKDILPVDCTIMDANNNQRDSECQTEQEESEASLWARALYELRKRKLDVVALATNTDTCKYCKTINCFHMSGFTPQDSEDKEDLTELDNWSPRTRNKSTQFTFQDNSKDVGTSVPSELCNIEKMLSKSHSSEGIVVQPPGSDTKEDSSLSTDLEEENQATSSQKLLTPNVRSIGFVPKAKSTSEVVIDDGHRKESLQLKAEHASLQPILGFSKSDNVVSPKQSLSDKLNEAKSKEFHEGAESLAKKRVSIADVIRVNSTLPEVTLKDSPLTRSLSKPSTKTSSIGTAISIIAKGESISERPMSKQKFGSDGTQNSAGSSTKQISFSTTGIDTYNQKKSKTISKIGCEKMHKQSAGMLQQSRSNRSDVIALKDVSWHEEKPLYDSEPNIIIDHSLAKYAEISNAEKTKVTQSDLRVPPSILLSSPKKISGADSTAGMQTEQVSDAQRKAKVEFKQSRPKEQFTETQHLSSLFNIETVKRLKVIADRKERLEKELRSNLLSESQIKVDSGDSLDPRIYLCSCLDTLKKSTCDACTCKHGICTTPKKSDLRKIGQMFDHMPKEEKRKMKCFQKVIYQIKDIMEENLDTETMDAKIIDVLTGIGHCKCEGEPCECKIHHLDVAAMQNNKNIMAATLLDKLNDVLDERYEAKLGEVIKKKLILTNTSTITDEPSAVSIGITEKRVCHICEMQNCKCILK